MKSKFGKHVSLQGSEKKEPKGRKLAGIDKKELINVMLKLRPANPLPDLMNPSVYAKFKPMGRDEFEKEYGSSDDDIRKTVEFANHAGLSVVKTEKEKRAIELRGSITQMEKAFGTSLSNYKRADGLVFRARKGAVKIPAVLQGIVVGIFGLDNRPVATPKFKIRKKGRKIASRQAASSSFFPPAISKLYNFPQDVTGKGQSIAIIELGGGFRMEDLTAYFKRLKLPVPKVVAVSVDGAHNSPGKASGPDGEVMLDIEVAAGIAPDAEIIVYFAANNDKAFLDAIMAAIHDKTNQPSVISISWGSAEGEAGGWTASSMNAFDQAFHAAATLGITVCAAAGDNGSNDNINDGKVHVDFPAASPFCLACGGTLLSASNGRVSSEVVWHEADGGATGGGISDVFPLPSYQTGATVDKSLNTGKPGRGVPDIAADADPASGYNIQVDGQSMVIGGTSAVAPMMAGLVALLNEKLGRTVGFIHPKMYAHTSVFRDITQGNNITTPNNMGYSAHAGWDACSGNGVPDGLKLLSILQ
jgi:kumamolisin